MLKMKKPTLKNLLPFVLAAFPALMGYTIVYIFRVNPAITENLYSQEIFLWISRIIASVTSLFPFSFAEITIFSLVLFVLIQLIAGTILLVKHPKTRKKTLTKALLRVIRVTALIYFGFCITTAPNYYRLTFTQQSGMEIKNSSIAELTLLCEELVAEANKNAQNISYNEAGYMILQSDILYESAVQAKDEFNKLHETYSFIPVVHSAPKPLIGSFVLSVLELSGFYFPYTAEANFNSHMPTFDIPSTMCHELAHTAGFMREDEANFLSYMACRNSQRADFQYSASIMGVTHAMNALYKESYEDFYRIYQTYDPRLAGDLEKISAYWKAFDTPIGEISDAVNDTYLKLNQQTDGTKSYGRVLDLMLAEYRIRHGI